MNPYIGDRPLDPPEDEIVCPHCDAEFYLLRDFSAHMVDHREIDMDDSGEPNPYPED